MNYEGKTKIVKVTDDYALLEFKDDITAGDGLKHDVLTGKGSICAETTAILMKYLSEKGIKTHLVEYIPPRTLKVIPLKMFPLEVVVRLKKAGSFVRRYGGVEGEDLPVPLVEFFIKDDERHDPMVCVDHLEILGIATREQAEKMKEAAVKATLALKEFFERANFELWDIKYEFGLDKDGNVVLGDEISPDTFRLRKKGEIFDKDVYRRDLGDPLKKYREVLELCRSLNSQ
ncbi:phosphoribosylaminoimidazole-succinocarboxamide synthase [Thermotoga petrophila RKU-1]|uniref:Phosphoribosylaminoimidazole-succinocarboxamide synthase n=1 Tax=Thermotoga petrophila (strain ATCC BAA-488 / DSM 13995 / JCM 10881 / RKU-1) TaxID=390874 RepID=PUR7_THEP1|nr:phosphoribosylaminoimidazolesuccinocarboxamide synthase [Thermotoga petrophila]A5IMW3.1 RecName: Full=Phosphoribosylaminoimidazole-succinocarboxamide synthase; AltName: Full=SAICAR synthetase [Thermotoga petrophila RKU-1]ABQ47536.1 phosphoribosylaminoimidazole-succinocarboxamide synthase [Thermotoga petrophila RKU-1]